MAGRGLIWRETAHAETHSCFFAVWMWPFAAPTTNDGVVLGCAQLLLNVSKKKAATKNGQRMQHRCQSIPPWWDNLSLHYGHKDYVG